MACKSRFQHTATDGQPLLMCLKRQCHWGGARLSDKMLLPSAIKGMRASRNFFMSSGHSVRRAQRGGLANVLFFSPKQCFQHRDFAHLECKDTLTLDSSKVRCWKQIPKEGSSRDSCTYAKDPSLPQRAHAKSLNS